MASDASHAAEGSNDPLIVVVDRACARLSMTLASTTLFVLTLDVLWGVVSRFVLGGQARWTEEAARLLLIWVSLLGGAAAYGRNAHLGLDLLVDRMEPAVATFARRCAAGFVYAFAVGVLLVGGGVLYAERLRFGQTMPALGIDRAWQYLAVPVAGAFIAISAVRRIVEPGSTGRGGAGATT